MKTQELVKYLSFAITCGYLSWGLTSCDGQKAMSSDNWATLETGLKIRKQNIEQHLSLYGMVR